MKIITSLKQVPKHILPVYASAIKDALGNNECAICYESLNSKGVNSRGEGVYCGCCDMGAIPSDDFYSTDRNMDDDEMDRYL